MPVIVLLTLKTCSTDIAQTPEKGDKKKKKKDQKRKDALTSVEAEQADGARDEDRMEVDATGESVPFAHLSPELT